VEWRKRAHAFFRRRGSLTYAACSARQLAHIQNPERMIDSCIAVRRSHQINF